MINIVHFLHHFLFFIYLYLFYKSSSTIVSQIISFKYQLLKLLCHSVFDSQNLEFDSWDPQKQKVWGFQTIAEITLFSVNNLGCKTMGRKQRICTGRTVFTLISTDVVCWGCNFRGSCTMHMDF